MSHEQAEWARCEVDRKALKALMRRGNAIGLLWLSAFLFLLLAAGTASYLLWGTVAGALAFILYGAVYGFFESLRHETHHGTPFRSPWINNAVHWFAGFMGINEPLSDRWLHTRHHSHTYETGQDPEIQTERPPSLLLIALDFFRLKALPIKVARIVSLAGGRFEPVLAAEVPERERGRIVASARLMVASYGAIVLSAVALQSWMPIVFTFGARVSGAWLHSLLAYTQHTGLPENVRDYRINTRTVATNPILRFLYWNMNYHIEHHMFPMVPFYNLPKLHRLLGDQMPAPYNGFLAAWREILPTLMEQRRNPDHFAERNLHPLAAD